ncbi:TPA: restriction endonuclease subunit S [Escherichia coli]|nr:restriction endonuclease subunit S [Escherichia coli]HAJ4360468.1 restriction endonuclease subunit S [Escherichia coli]HAW7947277.1 restriction endonuclease subunit S [Escherichia coli]
MPKYEAYKESGVDWLGEVPDCWDLVPIRGLLNFRNEKNDPIVTEDVLSLSIANGVTQYSDEGRGGNKRKDDLTAYKIARPNDIVMNSMNVIVGAVGVSKYFGAISPVYYALYAKDDSVLISFYERIFQNEGFQRGLLRLGKGILIKFGDSGKMNTIRMKISQNDLKVLMFPKPDSKTQLLISNFLDQKTAQIDEAIAIKEQQISLLKERKQIIIQQAVTQGLDPNVPMKDSGVDWIGKVPAHWEVKKMKTFARIKNGIDYKHVESDSGYSVYGSGGQFTFANRFLYKGEAVLLGRKGTIDKPLYVNEAFWTVDTMFYAVCNTRVVTKYLYFCATTIPFGFYSTATALPSMTQTDLLNHKFAVPSFSEQLDIIAFIEDKEFEIEECIKLQRQQISKLKEYKTTLINSAVTGKIKITPEMVEQ